jgi:hypothetical protein
VESESDDVCVSEELVDIGEDVVEKALEVSEEVGLLAGLLGEDDEDGHPRPNSPHWVVMDISVLEVVGRLEVTEEPEYDEEGGQPIPSPSKPSHCVVVVGESEVAGKLEDAGTLEVGDDEGEGRQPTPSPSKPSHCAVVEVAEVVVPGVIGELEGTGRLETGNDEEGGQPIPSPSKPSHCVVVEAAELVVPEVTGELEGAGKLEMGNDDDSGQPIPSKPSH